MKLDLRIYFNHGCISSFYQDYYILFTLCVTFRLFRQLIRFFPSQSNDSSHDCGDHLQQRIWQLEVEKEQLTLQVRICTPSLSSINEFAVVLYVQIANIDHFDRFGLGSNALGFGPIGPEIDSCLYTCSKIVCCFTLIQKYITKTAVFMLNLFSFAQIIL